VTTGPLAKYVSLLHHSVLFTKRDSLTIHLGPLASTMDPKLGIKPNPRADGYGDNPRCHRRDVNNYFTTNWLRPEDLLKQLTSAPDILTFQNSLQNGAPFSGLHGSGHFSIGMYMSTS
jgi:tyrosinase